MIKKVLISTSSFGKVDSQPLTMLQEAGFEVMLNPEGATLTKEQSIALLENRVALIAGTEPLDQDTFAAHPQLKYICRLGTGMNSVDLDAAKASDIRVENTPNAHVDGVAELCLAGILDLHRSVSFAHHDMKNSIWKKPMGSLLRGKTIGLIGLGKVAKRLVELLQPFEMQVLATDKYWDSKFAEKYNIQQASMVQLLEESNIVSLHIPYSKENHNLIGKEQLDIMKADIKLINTSRGGLVDEGALVHYLRDHSEASAYLDTFEQEPYMGELSQLDNVLMTPHIGSYAREVRVKMEMECAEKLIAFFNK